MNYSKIVTLAPIVLGLVMIMAEYLADFSVTQSQIQLIEFLIGGTIFGGVANKGFKRFIAYKEKIKLG